MKPTPCYPIGPMVRVIHHSVGRAFMTPAYVRWYARRLGGKAWSGWSPGGSIEAGFVAQPDVDPGQLTRLFRRLRDRPLTLVRVSASRLEWPGRWPKN